MQTRIILSTDGEFYLDDVLYKEYTEFCKKNFDNIRDIRRDWRLMQIIEENTKYHKRFRIVPLYFDNIPGFFFGKTKYLIVGKKSDDDYSEGETIKYINITQEEINNLDLRDNIIEMKIKND